MSGEEMSKAAKRAKRKERDWLHRELLLEYSNWLSREIFNSPAPTSEHNVAVSLHWHLKNMKRLVDGCGLSMKEAMETAMRPQQIADSLPDDFYEGIEV